MKYLKWMLFLMMSIDVMATPTGADLLGACEDSLENGFNGATGMMCVWYVTPCDCHHGKDIDIPRVCLPDGKTPESLAREVIDGMKLQPELKLTPAEVSAGVILSAKYPCNLINDP
jgi:Ssp1 endopeptidase immunity protein Rap1a